MNLDSTINLELGANRFTGWKYVEAAYDMEALTPTISFGLFDKESALIPGITQGSTGSPFQTGLDCQVSIENPAVSASTKILDGFVITTRRSIDGNSHSLEIVAADKTVDLLDCSAIHPSRVWTKKPFSLIVRDLTTPFGITVDSSQLKADTLIDKFVLQAGESPFDAIERLCRSEAVLPLSDFTGTLTLGYSATRAERAVEALEVGKNVLGAHQTVDWSGRFSEYTVIGQGAGAGKKWTREMLQAAATSRDTGVTRHRPKLLIAENKINNKVALERVKWESQIRSGRATEYSVVVHGWYQKVHGLPVRPWVKNERTSFKCDDWGVDEELLITAVTYSLDQSGERTALTLKHPDIFSPQPGLEVDLT